MKNWEQYFIQHRPYLVAFAFRMTGSLSEAEDIVQDAFIECAKVDPLEITNHKAWLTKVCSNRALDHLKSAYKRRETYPGTWLPDAVPDSYQLWNSLNESESPDKKLLVNESMTTTFLLLAEKLSPEERVVYLLCEVFEYTFKEIANFLNKTEEACRKIAQRARKALDADGKKFNQITPHAEKLIANFFETAKNGSGTSLVELLAPDSEFWSDGGGKVSATNRILYDPMAIAKFFANLGKTPIFTSAEFKAEFKLVNGLPGFVISKLLPDGSWVFDTIMSFEIAGDKIARIYAQRNPDKLRSLY